MPITVLTNVNVCTLIVKDFGHGFIKYRKDISTVSNDLPKSPGCVGEGRLRSSTAPSLGSTSAPLTLVGLHAATLGTWEERGHEKVLKSL